ncbi:MAG: DNA photolyase [Planctomycetota bacterium]|nr:DNA photolyase [Planctomycetota bacterium]
MVDMIYVEDEVADHPRVEAICRRLAGAVRVPCRHYGELFNRSAQNFRLQKRRPALILARKRQGLVLETPKGYGIGGRRNYYFSHMLNCVYDCRYCFLRGMFSSANYVLFVNYEDFQSSIEETTRDNPSSESHFFSGYDCDSLAFEPVTGFAASFLPLFERLEGAWVELRTKSVQVRCLLDREPVERCVVAFSMTPAPVSRELETDVPPLERRLEALAKLQDRGWKIGLRFDPLIYHEGYQERYVELFRDVFSKVHAESLHSVSLGPFRLPRDYHRRMVRRYPDEPLLAGPLEESGGMVSYRRDLEQEIVEFASEELLRYIPQEVFFPLRL